MNDYKFGNFLCELREAKGMTQLELANILNVTPAAVSKWENGESKPKLETFFKVAEIFEVTIEELMAGEYAKERKNIKFRLNVNITEKQYLDFNRFAVKNIAYPKKDVIRLRVYIFLITVLTVVSLYVNLGFSDEFIKRVAIFLVLLTVIQLYVPKILITSVIRRVKSQLKKEKKLYSPVSVVEFSDDCITEITPDDRSEVKYSSIKSVSVVEGKMIYIHINSLLACLIPVSSFESQLKYNEFLSFIAEKCDSFKTY